MVAAHPFGMSDTTSYPRKNLQLYQPRCEKRKSRKRRWSPETANKRFVFSMEAYCVFSEVGADLLYLFVNTVVLPTYNSVRDYLLHTTPQKHYKHNVEKLEGVH